MGSSMVPGNAGSCCVCVLPLFADVYGSAVLYHRRDVLCGFFTREVGRDLFADYLLELVLGSGVALAEELGVVDDVHEHIHVLLGEADLLLLHLAGVGHDIVAALALEGILEALVEHGAVDGEAVGAVIALVVLLEEAGDEAPGGVLFLAGLGYGEARGCRC